MTMRAVERQTVFPRKKKKPPAAEQLFLKINKTQADLDRLVDEIHHVVVQMRDFIRQALLIDRSDLLKQNHRIAVETIFFRIDFHVGGKLRLLNLRGYRRDHDRRAETVAYVILDD